MIKNLIKFLILILTVFLPFVMQAQDEAEPLLKRMHQAKGIEKIDLLNEISVVYRKSDRRMALDYAQQAHKLSVKENYLPGKALAKKNEGICWFFLGNNDSASVCYNEALRVFTSVKDDKGISACYNNLGLISQETGNYNEAIKYYQSSIDIDGKIGDETGANTTKLNVVDILIYKGRSLDALKLINEILMFYRKNSDKKGIVSTLINRAAVYDNLKFFDKALIDQKEAIGLARILKDTYLEAMAMSNNALVVWHTGDADKAIKILNRVLEMSTESDGDIEILNTLWILSEIYSSKREYAVSNEKLLELLKQYQGKDDKRGEAKVLTSLGRNLIELNEIDKALGYLNKSLEITIEIDASFEKLENYRNLVHVNAILHNLKTSDSLQDLFAETYSYLFKTDSIAISRIDYENSNQSVVSNRISFADWLTAFLLLIIMLILSVLVYKK